MSPEQVRAKELDARTDLFSFGAVLYEMATGAMPFRGESTGVVFESILNRTPVPPVRLNPDLPTKLEDIINKCLEKDRHLRYQHASEIGTDLRRLKRDTESGGQAASAAASVTTAMQSTAQPSQTSSSAVIADATQHKWGIVAGVFAVFILVGAAGFGVYSLLHRPAPTPFQKFTVMQVTNSGKAGGHFARRQVRAHRHRRQWASKPLVAQRAHRQRYASHPALGFGIQESRLFS